MADTLFDLTYKVAAILGSNREGTATGGSTTTLIDTNGLANVELDYYNEGTLWIVKSTDGEAPEGEFEVVKDFNNSNKTIEVQTALSATVGAGDKYMVSHRKFPSWLLVQQINSELYDLGLLPEVDETSLTTVANQREYTLPADASRDLRQVHVQTNKDSDRNIWIPVYNWEIDEAGIGTADKLVLAYDLDAGYALRLRYAVEHPELRAASDKLSEIVDPNRIVFAAAAACLRWYMDKTRLKTFEGKYQNLLFKAERASRQPMPNLPGRQRKITLIGLATRS